MMLIYTLQFVFCVVAFYAIKRCKIARFSYEEGKVTYEPPKHSRLFWVLFVAASLLPIGGIALCGYCVFRDFEEANYVDLPSWLARVKKYWIDDKI